MLEDLGYDPSMARWAAAADASLARVVRVDRGLVSVLGAAGPGRSWLVDALVGAEVLATRTAPGGRSSGTGGRGLVPLPGGGAVIDTPARPPAPGLRESGHRL